MDPLGLKMSWLPILDEKIEGQAPIRSGVVNLGGVSTLFPSHGIIMSMSFQFTTVGYLKTRAVLRAASVTISFELIVRTTCKVPPLAVTPPTIGGMMTGMISGMIWLINNVEENFR